MPPAHPELANGPRERGRAKPVQACRAVKQVITSELVGAYSPCPQETFLVMTEAANPGPHA
jgi:hypothetical protein